MTAPGLLRPRHPAKNMTPGRFLCIGTHHKTGTVWMRKVAHRICNAQGIPLISLYRARKMAELPENGPAICVNWSSAFPREMLDHPEARFIHVVRDPRDVLLSGLRYHRIAGRGNEKFLRQKRDEWGGRNYQDYLNSLPSERDQLLFEMRHKHDETLGEICVWDYDHPHSVELAYEDLIEDSDCSLFRAALETVDIQGLDVVAAVQSYWDEALFGGKSTKENRDAHHNRHVSAQAGRVAQWVTDLPRDVAELYEERYGAVLRKLGYEEDPEWPRHCPEPEDQISFAD